ncbi:MAG: protein phosphatase 2C domain-containing protein [Planctomycetaceae bacterium]|nr:protein phosphatase 2C domain-containing protein [Planctomycetaceae bacterium]
MTDQPLVQYASLTDVGMRRAANQDSLAVRLCSEYTEWEQCGHLFVVADGMGGHSVGDLASRISVESLPQAYFKMEAESISERLRSAIREANRAINDKARENPEFADMGTTCSTLALSPYGAHVGHVGDSRVYRVRNGEIQQLSFDHSLQWEMIRQGRATMENVDLLHPRNVITRCLGPDSEVTIDVEGPFHVQTGDCFVICSDGLTGHVSDTEIGAVASTLPPADASRLLINLANCRGGADNITVVIAKVDSYPRLTGTFKDSPRKVDSGTSISSNKPHALISTLSLSIFAFLATIGLALLAWGNRWGLLFICPALILGFIRLIASTRRPVESVDEADRSETTQVPDAERPAARSPYRTESARIERPFLDFLAEAQSELTQAAKDNGWEVSMDELAELNRQAVSAVENRKSAIAMQHRASAIDGLMKALYSQTRRP